MQSTQRITQFGQLDPSAHYTYADYLRWDFPERVELYKGAVQEMMPAPSMQHQRIVTKLARSHFRSFEDENLCELFVAPFDVRLPVKPKNGGGTDTVVQPDLCIVCDKSKLDRRGCNGAPDLVIEILSPGNSKREMRDKFALYEEAGVPEYWVVDPVFRAVQQFTLLSNGEYGRGAYFYAGDMLVSSRFPAWTVVVADVFPEETPEV